MRFSDLSGSRECIAVKPVEREIAGSDGTKIKKMFCQCSHYGPPGSARKPFTDLCREIGLPVLVGVTVYNGEPKVVEPVGDAAMGKRRKGGIEYPPMDDLMLEEMWDDLDQFFSQAKLMSLGTAALASGGSILLGSAVLPQIPVINEDSKLMSAAALALGTLGGLALWPMNREAAIGVAAGLGGFGLASLIGEFVDMKPALGGGYPLLGDAVVTESTVLNPTGVTSEPELLGDPVVTEESLLGATEVEEEELPGIGSFFS